MKILKIRLQNLNSLQGEQLLDFEQAPFVNAGLFAITGETGAGKTTLLDAITLALYGQVARRCDARETLTYGTNEGYAEVEFSVAQQRYRATWNAQRKLRGAKQGEVETKRQLAQLQADRAEIIAEKVREVDAQVEQITGLDYARFLRSVLLAQGDFAAFLKADAKDRAILLERITGADIYSELSKMAFQQEKTHKDTLNQLEQELNASQQLSETELLDLQSKIRRLDSDQQQRARDIRQLEAAQQWLQKCAEYQQEFDHAQQRYQQLTADYERTAEQRQQLSRHQQAQTLHTPLARWQDAQTALQTQQTALTELEAVEPELVQALQTAETAFQHAQQQAEQAQAEQAQLVPVLQQVITQDRLIADRRQQLQSDEKETEAQQQQVADLKQQLSEQQAQCEQLATQQQTVQDWLNTHQVARQLGADLPVLQTKLEHYQHLQQQQTKAEQQLAHSTQQVQQQKLECERQQTAVGEAAQARQQQANLLAQQQAELQQQLAGRTLADWEQDAEQLQSQSQQLEKAHNCAQQAAQARQQLSELSDSLRQQQQGRASLQQSTRQIAETVKQARALLAEKQRVYELSLRIQELAAHRAQLHEGEPCPLCGATEHPFLQHQAPVVATERQAVEAQQAQVAEYERQQRQLDTELTQVEAAILHAEKQQQALNTQLTSLHAQFQNIGLAVDFNAPEQVQQQLAECQQQRAQVVETLKQLRQQHAQLTQTGQQAQAAQAEASRASDALERAQLSLQHAQGQLQEAETRSRELTGQFAQHTQQLNQLLARYELDLSCETLEQTLQQRWSDWQTQQAAAERLQADLAQAQTAFNKVQQAWEQAQTHWQQQQQRVTAQQAALAELVQARQELFADQNPEQVQQQLAEAVKNSSSEALVAQQRLQSAREKRQQQQQHIQHVNTLLVQAQSSFTEHDQGLQAQLQQLAFNTVEALQAALLPAETVSALETAQSKLAHQLTVSEQQLQQAKLRLDTEQEKAVTQSSLTDITGELSALQQEQRALLLQQGAIESVLNQQQEQTVQRTLLETKVKTQQAEYQRWKLLSDLIGSSNGDKFRKFAQNLTLSRLVEKANSYLQQLNGRYLIQMDLETEMALKIQDTFQANHIRSMNTLSGGETFLVSLALALGLSDLAGAHTQIESLFIDEGFGTLDAETLDTAIVTLESLQALGKNVGIISHVEALKERITIQVQIVRQRGGFSALRLVG